MAVFIMAIYFARLAGANSEAVAVAQERARLAQMMLRRNAEAGAPILVRERQTESAPLEFQRVQLEPA
jgi:hypothetical protein